MIGAKMFPNIAYCREHKVAFNRVVDVCHMCAEPPFECQSCGETFRDKQSEDPDLCVSCANEDIICRECGEHTTRGEPCCA